MGERGPVLEWDGDEADVGHFYLSVEDRAGDGVSWGASGALDVHGFAAGEDDARRAAEGAAIDASAEVLNALRPSPHGVGVLERLAMADEVLALHARGLHAVTFAAGCSMACAAVIDKAGK